MRIPFRCCLLLLLLLAAPTHAEEAPAPILSLVEVATLSGHAQEGISSIARTVAFAPDREVLASGGNDRAIRFWDLATHRELAHVQLPRAG